MRSQVRVNKRNESYPCALSGSLEVRGKGKENDRNNKAAKKLQNKRAEKNQRLKMLKLPYLRTTPGTQLQKGQRGYPC